MKNVDDLTIATELSVWECKHRTTILKIKFAKGFFIAWHLKINILNVKNRFMWYATTNYFLQIFYA